MKKNDLKKFIESKKWISINEDTRTGRISLSSEQMCVRFYTNPKLKKTVFYCRIGSDVLKELSWKKSDKILLMYDPDDKHSYLLVKCDTGKGTCLSQEPKSKSCRLQIPWKLPVPEGMQDSVLVDYQIYQKYIHFKLAK